MSTVDLPELPGGFGWKVDATTAWIEARLDGARAAFTTRLGGGSLPPFGSLNLGVLTGDERGRVIENRLRIAGAIGIDPARAVIGRQVHRDALAHHSAPQVPAIYAGEAGDPPEVDGHILEVPGLAALVFVADCLPIVMAGPDGIAVVHAGWRGLARGIVEQAAAEVGATEMAVGPGIGPCCYEVGDEVLAAFARIEGVAQGRMLDLTAVARAQGRDAQIERVLSCGLCTKCNGELFFSHRGEDGHTGRQGGFGWREASDG